MPRPSQDPNAANTWGTFALLFVLSLVLHAALGGWMAVMPETAPEVPGQQPNQPRTIIASAAQIRDVVQQVRVRQADEVRDKVQELLDLQKALAAARTEKFEEYREAAQAKEAGALEKALAAELAALPAQEKATSAQQQAAALIPQAVAAWTEISQASDDAGRKAAKEKYPLLRKQLGAAFESAKQAQIEADNAAAEALRQITFAAGDKVIPVRHAQEAAHKTQASANDSQDTTADLIGATGEMNWQLGNLERETGHARGAANSARDRAKSLDGQLARLQKDIADRERQSLETAKKVEAKKSQRDIERLAQLTKEAENVRQKISLKIAEIEAQKLKIEETQIASAEKIGQLDQARQAIAAQLTRGALAQNAANTTQLTGIAAQKNAIDLLQKLLSADAAKPAESGDNANDPSAAVAQADAPGAESIDGTELASKNFGELYALAVRAEHAATSDYRDIRAATVAVLTRTTLEEASRITNAVQPNRASVDSSLFSANITSAEAATSHTQAVRAALGELDSMLALSRKMLETTVASSSESSSASEGGVNVTSESGGSEAKSEQLAALEAEAQNDENAQAKDLTALMKSTTGKPGSAVNASSTGAAQNVASKPSSSSASASSASPSTGGRSSGRGPVSSPNTIWPLAKGGANSVPGRKVLSGGGSADWMFLDSWYIIGPFPNPARRNITTAFPPESVIDLDASYAGDGGKSVRWRFVQSPGAMVTPKQPGDSEQAIYYAYTQLWFEEELDAWLALSSDDFGKVWVNDMPIWKSGTVAKPWVVDEAFRKVHFQKGINRVLFRVENCYRDVAFSVIVSTRKTEVTAP